MNRIKKAIFHSCLIATFITVSVCCTQSPGKKVCSEQISFTINPKSLKIELPVHFSDSVTANLVFDTGATALVLDSSFCTVHPSITHLSPDTILLTGSAWSKFRTLASIYSSSAMVARLGETNLIYDRMRVYDWKEYMCDSSDGHFHIPQSDTTHTWELNFEHNYIEIHSDSNFVIPKNSLIVPFVQGNNKNSQLYVNLPLEVTCSNGDTLTLNRTFLIDTGISWDMVLISRAPEFSFFNQHKDVVWTLDPSGYTRRYNVNATLSNQIQLDSLRIYTIDFPNTVPCNYLVGLNFLKRFNVYFDMKNRQLGLQPIKNFQRVVNPLAKRFHISSQLNEQGKLIITKIADYEWNYCKKAGLKEGDEVIAINGKSFQAYTHEENKVLLQQDTLVYDVLRKGKPLRITVIVDKNEIQGD